MEKEKGMPWPAFVGCVLAVASLPLVLALSWMFGPSRGYFALPLASVAAIVMLVVGIALIYVGFGRKGAKV